MYESSFDNLRKTTGLTSVEAILVDIEQTNAKNLDLQLQLNDLDIEIEVIEEDIGTLK